MKVKQHIVQDIKSGIKHAYKIISRLDKEPPDLHSLQSALSQLQQAEKEVAKIVGSMEVERIYERDSK